ncbi:DEAD/DEAH box helicase [Bradyrhizobium sp. JYMT SZCCT0428]|uniref:DEAD/DEAH box helicase n=1 Tax=Bradyrhizobium sp. JYMT SZCCT0428 TaxID=2807673 RepID=UPI001BA6AEA5|nr:DEAD/DEAH box helicase [Bradyrhizobium sp. JYMT SZCCT0428]MBR1154597.1 DEAD/DEAH box helicase [Bradyrhizobium sp. JYMT SZCCT0428]
MLTLRKDQRELMDAASAQMKSGHRRVLIQAPTGFGKTVLTSSMMGTSAQRGFHSIFIVHRRELLAQASAAFTSNGVVHGVITAGVEPDFSQLVHVATIGSLVKYLDRMTRPRFVCWDECHHLPAPGWTSLQEAFDRAFHIGLSATPRRLDGQGLRAHFDVLVCGPSVRQLQRRGHLARCRHYAPSSIDLSGVRTRLGDYHRGDLVAAVGRSTIDNDAVNAYQRFAPGKRALLFATSIEQSEHTVDVFNFAGIPAEHVDGKTSPTLRDAAIARFASGDTQLLSNVDLFGEGFDVPAIEAVLMLRPTKSLGLYLQMIGRALRVAPGKDHAIVVDLVGNHSRHGLVEDDRAWSLDAPPAAAEDHSRKLSVCAACSAVTLSGPFCNVCGAPPKPRRPTDVDIWSTLVSQPGLAHRLRGMSYSAAARWADDDQKTRIVAMARSLKPGWIWHRLREIAESRDPDFVIEDNRGEVS